MGKVDREDGWLISIVGNGDSCTEIATLRIVVISSSDSVTYFCSEIDGEDFVANHDMLLELIWIWIIFVLDCRNLCLKINVPVILELNCDLNWVLKM